MGVFERRFLYLINEFLCELLSLNSFRFMKIEEDLSQRDVVKRYKLSQDAKSPAFV